MQSHAQTQTQGQKTALYRAVASGDVRQVQAVLSGYTPERCSELVELTRNGDVDGAKAFAESFVPLGQFSPEALKDLETPCGAGEKTPLRKAVRNSEPAIVDLLMEAGADYKVRSKRGEATVLHEAIIVAGKVFGRRYANIGAVADGVIKRDGAEALKELAKVPDVDGDTVLHLVSMDFFKTPEKDGVEKILVTIMSKLLSYGLDVNVVNAKSGYTPLHNACKAGFTSCALLLLMAGANPNTPKKDDFTPLHLAALNGNVGCVAALLNFGADPTLKADNDGKRQTPLEMANDDDVKEILKKELSVRA